MAKKTITDIIEPIASKSHYIKEVDMIVPSHFVDWTYFSSNVKSWLAEIPIKKLYFGCNNPDDEYIKNLKETLSQYDKIEFIDQRGIKTLGMQIKDLMDRTDMEFFVYCHADARITRNSFLVLEADMFTPDPKDNRPAGIIESERVQYDYEDPKSYPDQYYWYHYRPRSFSGYQLIRMDAIINVLGIIQDDYIYRNEDIIFQNACENSGYRYVKSFGMHVHTTSQVNHKWTPFAEFLNEADSRAKTFDMQVKGIVKYCTPDDLTKKAWQDAFGICLKENKLNLEKFISEFIRKENPMWESAVWDVISKLIEWVYR